MKKCTECERELYAKGYCRVHYKRFNRHGSPESLTGAKPKEFHGMSNSSEYKSWLHMIQRCTNPKAKGYKYWGGKGIKVCERWRNSFVDFLSDMGYKPDPSYTIDRLDNSKGYEPGNCKWATRQEQHMNQVHGAGYNKTNHRRRMG